MYYRPSIFAEFSMPYGSMQVFPITILAALQLRGVPVAEATQKAPIQTGLQRFPVLASGRL